MTPTPRELPADDDTPPACAPTVARVQAVLDGDAPPDALAADPHAAACATCRGRTRAARLMLAALAAPPPADTVPLGLTSSILAGVRADRRARVRRWAFAAGGLAAAVLVAAWLLARTPHAPGVALEQPAPIPAPAPTPPPPLRITDEMAKAGDALRDSTATITGPIADTSKLFAAFTDAMPAANPAPVAPAVDPLRASLADLPDAARSGLEPVTGTAQKAFHRLLLDVGAFQPGKPKS